MHGKMLLKAEKERCMEAKQHVIECIGEYTDVYPLFVGEQDCDRGHTFGPYVREYYIIHFCTAGRGVLKDKYGTHKISAGEMFIIRPGEVTVYSADQKTPWSYHWIAFLGRRTDAFIDARSVYKTPDGLGERLRELICDEIAAPDIYVSFIYELMYRLFSNRADDADDKLGKIRQYIRYNYMENLRVTLIARSFGFERSYLYRIFKRRYGVGIKEYITDVRMEFAKRFLTDGYSVGECAHLVGYEDEFNFSKSFKKRFGISPSQIRREV